MSQAVTNLRANVLQSDNEEVLRLLERRKYAFKELKKPVRIFTKDMALDSIFQELETTRDENGDVIDTRFSPEIQTYIRSYLQEKEKEFVDKGYQSLRHACHTLKQKDRLELCQNLNEKLGYKVDIDKKLKGTGFFEGFKNKLAILGGGLAFGAAAGGIASKFKPNAVSDNLREPVEETINTKEGEYARNIPIVGGVANNSASNAINEYVNDNVLSKTLPLNVAVFSTAGLALGAAGMVATTAYDFVKNIVKRAGRNINYKKFLAKDNELYEQENIREADSYAEYMSQEMNEILGRSR